MNREELLEIVLGLQSWHGNIVKQLELVTEHDGEIRVDDGDGNQIKLEGDIAKGVKYGVIVALGLIKEFPLKITEN